MKKHSFSKVIVVFCVLEMTLMQFWSMKIAGEQMFLVTGLLTANHAVFGGELLLICLKRIMEKTGAPGRKKPEEGENNWND